MNKANAKDSSSTCHTEETEFLSMLVTVCSRQRCTGLTGDAFIGTGLFSFSRVASLIECTSVSLQKVVEKIAFQQQS